jgi:hypothetical protein
LFESIGGVLDSHSVRCSVVSHPPCRTRRRKNKAKINENYIEPENHRPSNRFTRRQNNSQLQSQNKNYRRQDGFNKINRELKSKNKYSVNQTLTRQQNVVHRNGTTYIGKNSPNHFLEQRVSDKAGGATRKSVRCAVIFWFYVIFIFFCFVFPSPCILIIIISAIIVFNQCVFGKNFPNHFLEQRVSDKAGGTPQNNIHPRRIQTTSNPKTEETLVKEISMFICFK